ncbi:hypothetical protein [Nocardiopsis suaedae]|uniref:PIN domain-containing protein n=1 Tax=Nocardiopsis suaedae TaxID=3018444 RepID=A0ABT4TGT9_9ACTN|nr:hypothetical protein [Nocardiopsis suaedae]MDA2803928.1 hypothetical protein [Nocardiopsis suaedae]
MIGGKILTASALSSWFDGSVYMAALVGVAKRKVIPLHVPTLALVQALDALSERRLEAVAARLDAPVFTFGEVGRGVAEGVARLTARWERERLSTADAHVIWASAGYEGWPVVVSHGAEAWKTRLPGTPIEVVP